MNNKFANFIIFVAGAATGSAVTWKLLKTKYERLAQEEIDSVKEVFSRKVEPKTEPETEAETPSEVINERQPSKASYAQFTEKLGYTDYANINDDGEEDKEPTPSVTPYVISSDDYGWAEGYETINLTYYADNILANDEDEVYEDLEGTVGADFHKHFGEYEPDAVHVRNDILKVEYEILRDRRTFTEATGLTYPAQTEEE